MAATLDDALEAAGAPHAKNAWIWREIETGFRKLADEHDLQDGDIVVVP